MGKAICRNIIRRPPLIESGSKSMDWSINSTKESDLWQSENMTKYRRINKNRPVPKFHVNTPVEKTKAITCQAIMQPLVLLVTRLIRLIIPPHMLNSRGLGSWERYMCFQIHRSHTRKGGRSAEINPLPPLPHPSQLTPHNNLPMNCDVFIL